MKFRKPYLYVAIILVISLLKLYKINGGVILGEPDETMYVDLVRNLSKSVFPEYNGIGWFFCFPFFFYFCFSLNFFFKKKFENKTKKKKGGKNHNTNPFHYI